VNTGDKIKEIRGNFSFYLGSCYATADRIESSVKADRSIGILHKVRAVKNSEENAIKIAELYKRSE